MPQRRLCPCSQDFRPRQLPNHASFSSPAPSRKLFPTDNRTLIQEEASNQPEQPTPPLPFLQLPPTTPSSLCRPLPTLLSHCVLTNPNNRSMRVITIPSMLNEKRVLETFRGSPKLRHNSSGPLPRSARPRQCPQPPRGSAKVVALGKHKCEAGDGVCLGCFPSALGSTCSLILQRLLQSRLCTLLKVLPSPRPSCQLQGRR